MPGRDDENEVDRVVVPIDDEVVGSMDQWLVSRAHGEPVVLLASAADFVAEVRSERERNISARFGE